MWSRVVAGIRARRRARRSLIAFITISLLWVAFTLAWSQYRQSVGDPEPLLDDDWYTGHRIVDRDGTLLRELPTEYQRRGRPVTLDGAGKRVLLSTLAAEDGDFYAHDGVDRFAILRAIAQNIRQARTISGASTITQQLVKLVDTRGISGPRTLAVKLREAARAQNLDESSDKRTILAAYINRLPYGRGLVGPEAAAAGYFGMHSRNLSWAQATFMAILPRAPSFLGPYQHPERVRLRQHALLEQMLDGGLLTPEHYQRALSEPIVLKPLTHAFAAPHFVQMLQAEARLDAGATTQTTLDATLQQDVEGLVRNHLAHLAGHSVDNAAVLVVDNATGDVLTYVGSADFDNASIAGQVDLVRSPRQPGSTLKPFVYGLAFANTLTPHQLVADVPVEFAEGGGGVYAPRNFHRGFEGPIPAREALAASLNVPVIRIAAELPAGALLTHLHELGFASLSNNAEHYGLALALGSGEVQLRELAMAYVTLARQGSQIELRYTQHDPQAQPERTIDSAIAAELIDTLSDPMARVRLLPGRSPFDIGYPLALKTGTSSGLRDAWTVGFSHERTVAVWIGNADGSAMHKLSGSTGAGPLFADVMRRAMKDVPTREPLWTQASLVEVDVCPLSGHPPGPACPHSSARRFAPAHVPTTTCPLHRKVRPSDSGFVCDRAGDEVVAALPVTFDRWLQGFALGAPGKDASGTPWISRRLLSECGDDEALQPQLRIAAPAHGTVIMLGHDGRDGDRVELQASFDGPVSARPDRVDFVIDGEVVAHASYPFRALVAVGPGDHEVYARPSDPQLALEFTAVLFSAR